MKIYIAITYVYFFMQPVIYCDAVVCVCVFAVAENAFSRKL